MEIGKLLIGVGVALTIIGAILTFSGRLPGDFVFRGRHTTFYFPLASSTIASLILSFIMWLLNRR